MIDSRARISPRSRCKALPTFVGKYKNRGMTRNLRSAFIQPQGVRATYVEDMPIHKVKHLPNLVPSCESTSYN